jgi:hypothetical protein
MQKLFDTVSFGGTLPGFQLEVNLGQAEVAEWSPVAGPVRLPPVPQHAPACDCYLSATCLLSPCRSPKTPTTSGRDDHRLRMAILPHTRAF